MPIVSDHIDPTSLDRLKLEVGEDMARRLIRSMRDEIVKSSTEAEEQFAKGDYIALEINAHSMKSVARSFGAQILAQASRILELAAQEQNVQQGQLAVFQKECENTLTALSHLGSEYSSS